MKTESQKLPESLCFRITRRCNARCRFCLAPFQKELDPALPVLVNRIEQLAGLGVKTIHFCGGEPTLYESLEELIDEAIQHKRKVKMTTNAISLKKGLPELLQKASAEVKVSLHGSPEVHEQMMGVDVFEQVKSSIELLQSSGVKVSLQSVLTPGGAKEIEWLIDFCLDHQIKRLSLLPLLARGRAKTLADDFHFSSSQRSRFQEQLKKRRRSLHGRLDLRWLDFNSKPFWVMDTDGRLVAEYGQENRDVVWSTQ